MGGAQLGYMSGGLLQGFGSYVGSGPAIVPNTNGTLNGSMYPGVNPTMSAAVGNSAPIGGSGGTAGNPSYYATGDSGVPGSSMPYGSSNYGGNYGNYGSTGVSIGTSGVLPTGGLYSFGGTSGVPGSSMPSVGGSVVMPDGISGSFNF